MNSRRGWGYKNGREHIRALNRKRSLERQAKEWLRKSIDGPLPKPTEPKP